MSFDTEHADEPRSRPRPKPAGGGFSVLGLIALLVALLTAGYVIYRDPPWGRLTKYNFSTPEQALRSRMQMQANGDYLAQGEYFSQQFKKDKKKELDSLKVEKTAEWRGKTAVFVRYNRVDRIKKTEKEVKEVVWFEKDEDTGKYREALFVDTSELVKSDEKLYKEIQAWEASARPNFGGPGGPID
jgi:hypothetical protein